MGVPAFFRWLSAKYASIVVHCVEHKAKEVNGVMQPVDASKPNPNDVEFDNLYLDMNGIIHPCCHPENKPAPKNEDEMMVLIFEYIDRIFSIVRPRRLLYMAIDGVAPRAKMNQQRSRRFRSSKESWEKSEEIRRIREELLSKGAHLPPEKPSSEKFDSNCITPGTPFMFRLADCLRYYIHDRLNNDAGWRGVKVILSDANVPGEGEHKIMDFIRRQRAQPAHDPNTHHCLCGADADLIMLGLATHEPYFTIIREEFVPNQIRPCELCGQVGHDLKDCEGLPRPAAGETLEKPPQTISSGPDFIFIRLTILREYLQNELMLPNLPFEYNFERCVDDWVFMCFFVGNDFLPHLPSLEIREGAIDRLVSLYKSTIYKTGGYLSHNGIVDLSRVQVILSELGEVEDAIFKKRRENDLHFKERDKERRKQQKRARLNPDDKPRYTPHGVIAPQPIPRMSNFNSNPRKQMRSFSTDSNNASAAEAIRDQLRADNQKGVKRTADTLGDSDEESEPVDNVKLWEDGFKERYYENKFKVSRKDVAFRHEVAHHYVRGLCWVLQYYYQGCPSWTWYFPYHYSPFASDFVNIGEISNMFEKDTEPFKPLEQLMAVFPAASKQHLPPTWQELMTDPDSPIIDFYPTDFQIDLNGKKFAWQGVALLPFVDERRLLDALATVYKDLTKDEQTRNTRGNDRLVVGNKSKCHGFIEVLYEGKPTSLPVELDTKLTDGMQGGVWCDELAVMTGAVYKSPLTDTPDLPNNRSIQCKYHDPKFSADFIFPAVLLKTVKMPAKVLRPEDLEAAAKHRAGRGAFTAGNRGFRRPQLGFTPNSGYRGNINSSAARRMIGHCIPYDYGERRFNNYNNSRMFQQHPRGYQPHHAFQPRDAFQQRFRPPYPRPHVQRHNFRFRR